MQMSSNIFSAISETHIMILILGGTTEGRKAVQVVESAGKPYYYSTVGNEQAIETVHAIRLTGGMDEMCIRDRVSFISADEAKA